jgi:hypothetical protein
MHVSSGWGVFFWTGRTILLIEAFLTHGTHAFREGRRNKEINGYQPHRTDSGGFTRDSYCTDSIDTKIQGKH